MTARADTRATGHRCRRSIVAGVGAATRGAIPHVDPILTDFLNLHRPTLRLVLGDPYGLIAYWHQHQLPMQGMDRHDSQAHFE
jgi:hypothetical protein